MSRLVCYPATVSHCRGGEISTQAEQTVTLLLPLIARMVRSLQKQNRLLHCYCLSLQGWFDLYTNRTDCYTVTVSLQGWCDLYTSRTDCYTATVSHCRGGVISTRAEQTVTVSLQGWFDLYMSRTDCYCLIAGVV